MDWIKKRVKQTTKPPFATLEEYQQAIVELERAILAEQGRALVDAPAAEPEPEPVATEVIGWRGWHLSEQCEYEPILRSITKPVLWPGPMFRADKAPRRSHEHGIYALKDRPNPGTPNATYYMRVPVFGRVALSGIVLEGERGYRAEQCVIRELVIANPCWIPDAIRDRFALIEIAGMLEQRYQADVQLAQENWEQWESAERLRAMRHRYA